MSTLGKKSQGRKKIEMKKITDESHMAVSFSKRRYELIKKANELNTLCGTKMALIVFSPGGKVFSFGHPNVEVVIERYLSQAMPQPSENMLYLEALRYGGPHDVGATSGSSTVGPSNGMIPLLQLPPPIAPQVFPSQFFQDPIMQSHHLLGGFNMKVYAGQPDDGAATANDLVGCYDGMILMQHPQQPPLNDCQPLLFQWPMMQSHQFLAGFNMGGNGEPSDDGDTISSAAIGPYDGIIPLNRPPPPQVFAPNLFQAP